tara:strand:+ start:323 stop:565 length:243 start_codon:yes stop_codon:yes gene_type:complete
MKFIFLKKRSSKATLMFFLIVLYSCGGGGGSQGNISNEFSSQSQPSDSNQNSNADQFSSLNVEIVENRFGKCNFGECKFE